MIFDKEISTGKSFTCKYLMRVLKKSNLQLGCTEKDIQKKCHSEGVKLGRWDNKGTPTVNELYNIRSFLDADQEDDDRPPETLCLLPLRDGQSHILINSDDIDVAKNTTQSTPRNLEDGSAYTFTMPVASGTCRYVSI